MYEKYFLRLNNIVTGPFARHQLLQKIKTGQIQINADSSVDKISWQPLHASLNLIIPDQSNLPPCPAPEPVSAEVQKKPVAEMTVQTELAAETEISTPAENCSILRVIADTLGSLGNGSGYLQKLWQKGSGAMIGAGLLSLFLAVAMTVISGVLFANRYDFPRPGFYLRSIVFILLAGSIFWIFNLLIRLIAPPEKRSFKNEADFLSAMHGMMNLALLTLLAAGSLWLFKNNAAALAGWKINAIILAAVFIFGFFTTNIIVSLRINFFDSGSLGAGWATFWAFIELWLTLTVWFWLVKPLYI